MNAVIEASETPVLAADLEALLVPIADDAPGGVSLRYDPVYQAIRQAREHDDETLPMGDWERPLVKADWKRVAALCGEALRTRSKDFQLAAWLCEAWTHLGGIDGLFAGTQLMIALAQRFWDSAHPLIEEDDAEPRAAPFVWLNETLPSVLMLHVPLLTISGPQPIPVNLERWERSASASLDDAEDGSGPALTRDFIEEAAAPPTTRAGLAQMAARLGEVRALWTTLDVLLDTHLGDDAPSLARVADVSGRLLRAASALAGPQSIAQPQADAMRESTGPIDMQYMPPVLSMPHDADAGHRANGATVALGSHAAASPSMPVPGGIASRDHAYRMLAVIADYLALQEPHSPTPYLLKRAVSWGQMPLPDLMREVAQEEGGLARYLSMLGLH